MNGAPTITATAVDSPTDGREAAPVSPGLARLIATLADYLDAARIDEIIRAYHYAAAAHGCRTRRSGEPYITHPVAVGQILAEMHMDHHGIMAALLHDVLEDTSADEQELRTLFGDTVAELVDGVSKLQRMNFASQAEAQAENFLKMTMAMAKDIRVILVKLADRLHNMRTLGVLASAKRRRIARETLEIYAPIAHRLGMYEIRAELEDLGFQALYPMRARRIEAAVRKARGNRDEMLATLRQAIQARLEQTGLPCRVMGRERHLYSIYRKMREERKSFNKIMDVYAFRVIVDQVDSCYRALGVLHGLYKPVPGRFRDYIAIPKGNGYQSLHTTLIGLRGVPIDIQICTEQMEAMAHHGVAARRFLDGCSESPSSGEDRTNQWLQGLLEMQKVAGDSIEFIENVKIDLFPDEVYVFTPKGKILELPVGATAIDFAYAIHTDIGHSCVGCQIDQRLAPLSEQLRSGQTVKIITSPGARPNVSWLNFAVTAKARSSVRHYLKNQQYTEAVDLGRRLLQKSLSVCQKSLDELPQAQIDQLLQEYRLNGLDALLSEIGLGNRPVQEIVRKLLPGVSGTLQLGMVDSGTNALIIGEKGGMLLNYARCCYPIPGDAVVGQLSSGRGITIHQETCRHVEPILGDSLHCLAVQWQSGIEGEFVAGLRVEMKNKRGMLASVASAIADSDSNIERVTTADRHGDISMLVIEVSVRDRVHLARVIRKIKAIDAVSRVFRSRS